MIEVYGCYHGRLLALARSATVDKAWEAKLREIPAAFNDDCRLLPRLGRYVLRNELSSQIEREALQFSDADKRAVLTRSPNDPSAACKQPDATVREGAARIVGCRLLF